MKTGDDPLEQNECKHNEHIWNCIQAVFELLLLVNAPKGHMESWHGASTGLWYEASSGPWLQPYWNASGPHVTSQHMFIEDLEMTGWTVALSTGASEHKFSRDTLQPANTQQLHHIQSVQGKGECRHLHHPLQVASACTHEALTSE